MKIQSNFQIKVNNAYKLSVFGYELIKEKFNVKKLSKTLFVTLTIIFFSMSSGLLSKFFLEHVSLRFIEYAEIVMQRRWHTEYDGSRTRQRHLFHFSSHQSQTYSLLHAHPSIFLTNYTTYLLLSIQCIFFTAYFCLIYSGFICASYTFIMLNCL